MSSLQGKEALLGGVFAKARPAETSGVANRGKSLAVGFLGIAPGVDFLSFIRSL